MVLESQHVAVLSIIGRFSFAIDLEYLILVTERRGERVCVCVCERERVKRVGEREGRRERG